MTASLLLASLLLCCTPAGTGEGAGADSGGVAADGGASDAGAPADASYAFSYVLIADPHVTGPGDHADRLQQAVDWVVEHQADRHVALVFVLGDIAWSDGFDDALAILSELPVPWVPVLGDNPIQAGDEQGFEDSFGPVLDTLADQLDGWVRAPRPVDDAVNGGLALLQNNAFDYGGMRFVSLDWNTRVMETGWGEMPDLHDFDGGTLPFLQDELARAEAAGGKDERMVLLTHMPMIEGPGSFDVEEGTTLESLLGPQASLVSANHSGHLHFSADDVWEECGLDVDVTDATWDDEVTIRVVDVSEDDARFHLDHELIKL